MSGCLPPLRPDELPSSLISRFAQALGVTERKAAQMLFREPHILHPQHPKQLPDLAAWLEVISVEQLICRHTTFLLTGPFCERALQTAVLLWMHGNAGRTRWRTARTPDGLFSKYRFCPQCMREQEQTETGEHAWLRQWQIPANTICLRHDCALLELDEPFRDKWGVPRLLNPNTAMEVSKARPLPRDRHAELIAETVAALLNARTELPEISEMPALERLQGYYAQWDLNTADRGMCDFWGTDWLADHGIHRARDLLRGTRARSWLSQLILLKSVAPDRELADFLWDEELRNF